MTAERIAPAAAQQASPPVDDAAQKQQFEEALASSMLSGATSMFTQFIMDIAGDQMSEANSSE
ncbi:hypothetical protein ACTJJ7_02890 [Phyllobacterium sp. 22229]|uniref:Uncharacterized protein n=1 Tax=Phyllobacterium myrsinacearum TaxID=28101 RepID=A0A2S9JQG3_9HYPH|nr:hypothetical protein [Phyllobacterium myrsinacearum]PRD55425.1 hypothetical protein C5750_09725 [Phyllobacterium myrsinacearum]PWV91765.1 hypothetical protein DEV92_105116 [Phyllobacterium myrsinacearum]RZS77393.1 hypothetical protein EV217_4755 [Phyllobacterium myrsinacearum]RZV05834.1 hypothetical protein EV654_3281 [Phyllobacterium myrsinacearum]